MWLGVLWLVGLICLYMRVVVLIVWCVVSWLVCFAVIFFFCLGFGGFTVCVGGLFLLGGFKIIS